MVHPHETRAHIERLIARLQLGEPVSELLAFVVSACPPPPPPEPDWLGKLFFGSFQPPAERVVCEAITPHEDDPFESHRLFWVRVRGTTLDRPVLPGRSSMGLFAYGPDGYRHVSRHRAEVEAMLDADARPIDAYEPAALARVLIDALAGRGPHTHALIDSPHDLAARCAAHGYRLDEAELRRCRPHLIAPTIRGSAASGWELDLCTVYGWMHDKRTFCRLRYRIVDRSVSYRDRAPRFQIEEHVETFSDRFFREVPLVPH